MTHPAYWFYHEYLDEARRFRVHKHTADTENEARKMHRQAAQFAWVTAHIEPTISPLFTLGDGRDRAIIPGQRQGLPYVTHPQPVPCPPDVWDKLKGYTPQTIGGTT